METNPGSAPVDLGTVEKADLSDIAADIVAKVNREVGEFLNSAEIRQRLLSFGLATSGAGTPESTGQFIRREQDQWQQFARELDVQPQ